MSTNTVDDNSDDKTHLRELIYQNFADKSFSPREVAEVSGRDLRSVRTSLQRFTRAGYVIREERGSYILNAAHAQVVRYSGIATSPVVEEAAAEEAAVETPVTTG
jgi:predicted transcriptional regulator